MLFFQVLTKQLINTESLGYREVLKEISIIKGKHIVLACKKNILWEVLNQAQQVGMLIKAPLLWIKGYNFRISYPRAKLDTYRFRCSYSGF